jgi:hypothetical protein
VKEKERKRRGANIVLPNSYFYRTYLVSAVRGTPRTYLPSMDAGPGKLRVFVAKLSFLFPELFRARKEGNVDCLLIGDTNSDCIRASHD